MAILGSIGRTLGPRLTREHNLIGYVYSIYIVVSPMSRATAM